MDKDKKTVSADSALKFLVNIMDKSTSFTQHIDNQINILLGISTAIFVFSTSRIEGENSVVFFVLGLFSAVSALIGLSAIHPPKSMRKHGQRESIIYNKKINSYPSPVEYKQRLLETVDDFDKMAEQYSIEIYNMYNFYYKPKRALYKVSRSILFAGIITSVLLFIIFALIWY